MVIHILEIKKHLLGSYNGICGQINLNHGPKIIFCLQELVNGVKRLVVEGSKAGNEEE